MIQITFKGKRKGGDEWLEGDLNHIDGAVYIFDRHEGTDYELNSPDFFEVEPETVAIVQGCENCKKNTYELSCNIQKALWLEDLTPITYCTAWEAKQ